MSISPKATSDCAVKTSDDQLGQTAVLRAPAHKGPRVHATVVQIGLHTRSLDGTASAGSAPASVYQQPEHVWVRLRPEEPLPGDPVTGTTARAVIRVR